MPGGDEKTKRQREDWHPTHEEPEGPPAGCGDQGLAGEWRLEEPRRLADFLSPLLAARQAHEAVRVLVEVPALREAGIEPRGDRTAGPLQACIMQFLVKREVPCI